MAKLVITFEEEDLLNLQEVLLDEDEKAALDFIKTRIAPKIPGKGAGHCDSSRRNPYLMKPDAPA
ncbi:hypothetical protein ACFLS1_01930 [Verrucomicrobiota bacterium]